MTIAGRRTIAYALTAYVAGATVLLIVVGIALIGIVFHRLQECDAQERTKARLNAAEERIRIFVHDRAQALVDIADSRVVRMGLLERTTHLPAAIDFLEAARIIGNKYGVRLVNFLGEPLHTTCGFDTFDCALGDLLRGDVELVIRARGDGGGKGFLWIAVPVRGGASIQGALAVEMPVAEVVSGFMSDPVMKDRLVLRENGAEIIAVGRPARGLVEKRTLESVGDFELEYTADVSDLIAERNTLLALFAGLGIPLVTIGCALSIRYGQRRIAAPLRRLEAAARTLSEGGYRLEVVEDGSIVEIDSLSRTFASMAHQIARHQEDLEAQVRERTTELNRELAERALREEELRRKNEELERFTFTVSHDLRSPLVTISAFLDYLEKDMAAGNAERIAKHMGFIRNAAKRMHGLLSELLKLSRIGRQVNPPEEIRLQEVVKEALELVAGRIAQRGASIVVAETPVVLRGDRVRVREVFQNLIDNAVKYMGTQASPRIEIGCRERDGATAFFVKDNGMGIDPRHVHKLFGMFEKLHPDSEGNGMGLALSKRIVEFHGGRVWVESEGLGSGTTFYFTLGAQPVPVNA